MTSTPYTSLRLSIAAALLAASAVAVPPVAAAERGHGAHQHGVGQLNLAVEGANVEIEITAPGADIAGFEHVPSNEADRKAVDAAVAKLKDGAGLFRFPDKAGCRLDEADVSSPLMVGAGHGHDKDHGHGHGKEHGHGQEKGHGHDAEPHAEFRAHYHFRCADPAALTHVDLGYFKAFPDARELEARTVTARGQGAQELTAERSRLTF